MLTYKQAVLYRYERTNEHNFLILDPDPVKCLFFARFVFKVTLGEREQEINHINKLMTV